jgi:hypothetical protein
MAGRCPFVQARVVRIELPSDEWIDVKAQLNAGERREMFASMRRTLTDSTGRSISELDPVLIFRAKFSAYVLGWSFTLPDGTPAPVTPSAFDNLDDDTDSEIRDAISAHEDALEREKRERKNFRDGVSRSGPTSPSAG